MTPRPLGFGLRGEHLEEFERICAIHRADPLALIVAERRGTAKKSRARPAGKTRRNENLAPWAAGGEGRGL